MKLNAKITNHTELYKQVYKALEQIRTGIKKLRELGVIRTKRDIRVDLCEWYVSEAFNGERTRPAQKGWDVCCNEGRKIQVRFIGLTEKTLQTRTGGLSTSILKNGQNLMFSSLSNSLTIT
jgi:hypothetical protein